MARKRKENAADLEKLYEEQQRADKTPQDLPPYNQDPYLSGNYGPGYQGYPPQAGNSYQETPSQSENGDRVLSTEEIERGQEANSKKVKSQRKRRKAPKTKDDDERFRSKLRRRYILRALLIILNMALIGYFVYETAILIRTYIADRRLAKEQYITLCGRSKSESEKLYAKYALDGYRTVNDYALVGNDMFLSDNHVEAENLTNIKTLQLSNVCLDLDKVAFADALKFETSATDFRSGIDLFSTALTEGDYLIYDRTSVTSRPLKVGTASFDLSYYTLPDQNNNRREIRIRNFASSPATVISVKSASSIPADYYDLVISAESGYRLPAVFDRYKIKIVETGELLDAYKVRAPKAVLITDCPQGLQSSHDGSAIPGYPRSETLTSGKLSGYDQNDFIRELSGYVQAAGMCYAAEGADNCSLAGHTTAEHVGKSAYLIDRNSDIESELKKILTH